MTQRLRRYLAVFCAPLAGAFIFLVTPSLVQASTEDDLDTQITSDIENRDYPLSFSGSYLAALTANRSRDFGTAALFYGRALQQDPDNLTLVERAFLLQLADGAIDAASPFAETILANDPKNRFAHMTLGAIAFKGKSYKGALRSFNQVEDGPLARLTGVLLQAWTLAADTQYDAALALLDQLEGPEWYDTFRSYHAGLIAEAGGQNDLALKYLQNAYDIDPNVIRTAEALARFQLRNGKEAEGKALVKNLAERVSNRPSIDALTAEIAAGETPKRHIKNAMQGAMEVLFGLGSAIGREGGEEISYVYLNLAAYLDPRNALPRLALGELLEEDKRYQRAIDNYAAIGADSIYKTNALMREAFAYNALDKLDEARALMRGVIEAQPDNLLAISSYGNILRAHELYDEARTVYSSAIDQIKAKPQAEHWALYYSRGIANERTKRWSEAEADFRRSLALSPDQPQVLNYLGYSLIDMGLNYDEALEMIKTAVRLRPDDAFIIDSLGWAYFKHKDYENAVKQLERAVELRPQDPILNDHLGDAYWHVGRKLEAIFQWSHARDLQPEPDNLAKIVEKIEKGYIADKNDG